LSEEGRNIAIEYRWAENQSDRLPAWAPDLERRQVGGDCHARWKCGVTCWEPTTTTPVVFYGSADPVESGLVASLNRPVGNVTGVVTLNIDTGQKRLELGSTTARSGDEVALIAGTISHYPPVLNASLSNKFLAPVSKKKNAARPWVKRRPQPRQYFFCTPARRIWSDKGAIN
jgi:ABC transporter substrate binding protein